MLTISGSMKSSKDICDCIIKYLLNERQIISENSMGTTKYRQKTERTICEVIPNKIIDLFIEGCETFFGTRVSKQKFQR